MWQQRLQEWIRHPETLGDESLVELKELLERYPYFQTARLLYLKNLFLLDSPSFMEELRKGALFVADLSVLFYFIEGGRFQLRKHLPETDEAEKGSSDRTLDLINRFLSDTNQGEADGLLSLSQEAHVDYTPILLGEEPDGGNEVLLPLKGQDLIDQFIESTSADGGFMADMPEPMAAEEGTERECPVSGENDTHEDDESFFTETLAKIYVKQQRYDKALEIIKKLNLKYQKKNTYFADQIRFLEKLIINAKSK